VSVLLVILPLALLLAIVAVIAFVVAVRGGQFDDLDSPAHRMLDDDDELDRRHADDHDRDR